jgi:hypothetical protein
LYVAANDGEFHETIKSDRGFGAVVAFGALSQVQSSHLLRDRQEQKQNNEKEPLKHLFGGWLAATKHT